jgi:phosphohistidine phosphatase
MLTLSLLRHAKSDWGDPTLQDFDRPLSERGAEAAPRMGAHMRKLGLQPDLILCSASVRTRATLTLVLAQLRLSHADIRYEDGLYLAAPAALVSRLKAVEAGPRHILLVGHNPGIQMLALELAGSGKRHALKAIATKFPTCGLAVLTFDIPAWSQLAPASARLVEFMTPRLLG